jgi:hypothetical protein
VYALGLFALVVALAVAARSRRRVLADAPDVDGSGDEPARETANHSPRAERADD